MVSGALEVVDRLERGHRGGVGIVELLSAQPKQHALGFGDPPSFRPSLRIFW